MMKKTLLMLVMLVMVAFTASAEVLEYKVSYNLGEVVTVEVYTDISSEEDALLDYEDAIEYSKEFHYTYHIEIIDYDSLIRDRAIVNKLDKLNIYCGAYGKYAFYKINGEWRKVYWD